MYIYKSIYDVKKLWVFLKLKGKTQEYVRHTLFIKKRKKEGNSKVVETIFTTTGNRTNTFNHERHGIAF